MTPALDVEATVIGAGVVGCASALALARRGVSVALVEAEPEPGLAASGTNSGIVHTGFDSPPGELETELILRSAALRPAVVEALGIATWRCGAVMQPLTDRERPAVAALADNAGRNGVEASLEDGQLRVPGESVTDPVAYTLALAAAGQRHGTEARFGFRVEAVEAAGDGLAVVSDGGERVASSVVVNAAGLGAGAIARSAGDESFDVYPRKGEFLVFEQPADEPLETILLPVPTKRTKGVLVFPTLDGNVVAGPTAVDQDDPDDWSVRPEAADEILPKATAMYPPLSSAQPTAAYAGLRPAGRGSNYVIGPSRVCEGLIHAAAIRSTGLTASLAIGERVTAIASDIGLGLGPEQPPLAGEPVVDDGPWWRRTAEHRSR